MLMFGKRNSSIVRNKNNTVAGWQQVNRVFIPPGHGPRRQIPPQKLYNSGF
jgi:hypothetical protein